MGFARHFRADEVFSSRSHGMLQHFHEAPQPSSPAVPLPPIPAAFISPRQSSPPDVVTSMHLSLRKHDHRAAVLPMTPRGRITRLAPQGVVARAGFALDNTPEYRRQLLKIRHGRCYRVISLMLTRRFTSSHACFISFAYRLFRHDFAAVAMI